MGNPEKFQQCNGKSCHSYTQALKTKRNVGRGRDKDVRVYFCKICHYYHLTKKKNDIKFQVQNKRKMFRLQEKEMVREDEED